jgi:hypothetical protein
MRKIIEGVSIELTADQINKIEREKRKRERVGTDLLLWFVTLTSEVGLTTNLRRFT